MKLEEKLNVLHDVLLSLPDTQDKESKKAVLEEAARALIFIESEHAKQRFLAFVDKCKRPLTATQKRMLEELR